MFKVPAGLIAAVLAVPSWAPSAQAQVSGFAAKVNVPFAFETAAGQHFSPGVYTLSVSDGATMLIRGKSTSGMALIQMESYTVITTRGKAVFTQYGDKYFLRSIWVAGNGSHLLCKQSKVERELEAASNKTAGGVELALLQTGR